MQAKFRRNVQLREKEKARQLAFVGEEGEKPKAHRDQRDRIRWRRVAVFYIFSKSAISRLPDLSGRVYTLEGE
jgi:hypothetical protein